MTTDFGPTENFRRTVTQNIECSSKDLVLRKKSRDWQYHANKYLYIYNFSWMGRPIIQLPPDIIMLQELIWEVKPDLIIETGIAHGGSLVFSASMLALLDLADAISEGATINPSKSQRKVIGIDIDIRAHNRAAIEAHAMSSRIEMIEGSSISENVVATVKNIAKNYTRIMIFLDSNHTHEHVLAELNAYAHLTSIGSYCVVFDTALEDAPPEMSKDRPWGYGNNPKTAVLEYLASHPEFAVDRHIDSKTHISVAPEGYLRRVF